MLLNSFIHDEPLLIHIIFLSVHDMTLLPPRNFCKYCILRIRSINSKGCAKGFKQMQDVRGGQLACAYA